MVIFNSYVKLPEGMKLIEWVNKRNLRYYSNPVAVSDATTRGSKLSKPTKVGP